LKFEAKQSYAGPKQPIGFSLSGKIHYSLPSATVSDLSLDADTSSHSLLPKSISFHFSHKSKMNTYLSILLCLGLAELLRRFILALFIAFTGPLSKIPGPLLWKLTPLPWLYECLAGNMMNVAPGLFEKYGDVVRVGKYINLKILLPSGLIEGLM
jgi:hypothetical protein